MSRPAHMRPGDFYATCNRLREDHKKLPRGAEKFCAEEFHDFASAEAHTREVHPTAYRSRPKSPVMVTPRRKPWNAPVVKVENQAVPPGTEFVHKGRRCQVVGAVSGTRTKFLAWLPVGEDPRVPSARRVVGGTADGADLVLWEITAPTQSVINAIGAEEVECDS